MDGHETKGALMASTHADPTAASRPMHQHTSRQGIRHTLIGLLVASWLVGGCAGPGALPNNGMLNKQRYQAPGYQVSVYTMASSSHADWYCRHRLGASAMYGNDIAGCARRQIVNGQILCEIAIPAGAPDRLVIHEVMHCAIGRHHP